MRVCLITSELPPHKIGGIGEYTLGLAKGYHTRGHDVEVVGCGIHRGRVRQESWGRSVSLGGYNQLLKTVPGFWRLHRAILGPRLLGPLWVARHNSQQLKAYLGRRGDRFDVIEAPNTYGLSHLLPDEMPVVVRLSSPSHFMLDEKPLRQIEAQACRRARLVIANSYASEEMCRSLYAPLDTPFSVVHHGIPDADPSVGAPSGVRLKMAYLGQAQLRKGTDVLLRALADLPDGCDAFEFDFIRADIDDLVADNPELQPVWRRVRDRHGDRVRTLGLLSESEKQRKYCETDVFVVPSRFESFGLVAAEAMRAGAVVLGASAGGLREVVAASPHNKLVSPGDAEALVGAMAELICEGPARVRGVRCEQREAFLNHFHVDRMVELSLELYERVKISGESPRGS